MTISVLLGTHIHPATGDAARRQIRAMTKLRDLSPITPVNLQFADRVNVQELEGFDTLAVLEQDSNRVTRQPGVRKPVVSEMFTRLAETAVLRNARYFGFTNSDIVFTRAAIDRIQQGDRLAYVLARADFEAGTEQDTRSLIYGTDVFAVDAVWWLTHRRRFRPYIVGESCWDNVYTAQLLCWAGGLLLNREPLVRHEAHPAAWRKSPFADHNGYLAALDRIYFTRWAIYADRLEKLRQGCTGCADQEAELQLQAEVFAQWRPTMTHRLLQAMRVSKLVFRKSLQIG